MHGIRISIINSPILTSLLTQEIIWTSIQRFLNVVDAKATFCAYWQRMHQVQLDHDYGYTSFKNKKCQFRGIKKTSCVIM